MSAVASLQRTVDLNEGLAGHLSSVADEEGHVRSIRMIYATTIKDGY
jgi:hypothetical protein